YKVYEDEKVIAFLDVNPLSKGHTLVLPKQHFETVLDIPSDLYSYLAQVVQKVAKNLNEKYKPEGILINQNNGERAGQVIPHVHIHVKPIYKDTQMVSEASLRKSFTKEEMESFAKELSFK
ncbi:MAG TPA: HIT domain-containing protein, partial [Candidatus Dojkabacteria bacterium]|nr:HIT domain-containing protein [Candidatus Dojkabacteria bacterium]